MFTLEILCLFYELCMGISCNYIYIYSQRQCVWFGLAVDGDFQNLWKTLLSERVYTINYYRDDKICEYLWKSVKKWFQMMVIYHHIAIIIHTAQRPRFAWLLVMHNASRCLELLKSTPPKHSKPHQHPSNQKRDQISWRTDAHTYANTHTSHLFNI